MSQSSMSSLTGQMPQAPDPTAGAQGDPSQGQASGGGDGGGFVIILAFQQDGSIQISSQGGSDDGSNADGGSDTGATDGASGGSDQPQVVDSLDDAMQAVAQLAQQNGYTGSDDDSATPVADGDAPMQPDAAKQMWAKMAAKKDKARMAAM